MRPGLGHRETSEVASPMGDEELAALAATNTNTANANACTKISPAPEITPAPVPVRDVPGGSQLPTLQKSQISGQSVDNNNDDGEDDEDDDYDDDDDEFDDDEEEDLDEDEEDDFYDSDDLETGISIDQRPNRGQIDDGANKGAYNGNNVDDHASDNDCKNNQQSSKNPSSDKCAQQQQHLQCQQQANKASSDNNQTNPSTHYNTVNDSWFINYNGIIVILPIIFNAFQDKQLEQAYQRYSHGQRQKSLVIAHLIDLLLKIALLSLPLLHFGQRLSIDHLNNATSTIPRSAVTNNYSDINTNRYLFPILIDDYYTRPIKADGEIHSSHIQNTFSVSSVIQNDLDDLYPSSSENNPFSDEKNVESFIEYLLFGPLAPNKIKPQTNGSQVSDYAAKQLLAAPEQPLTHNNNLKDAIDHIYGPLDLVAKMFVVVKQTWPLYQIPLLFGSFNLLIILTCSCVPHRYLTNKLSYLALLTWFLMCMQSYLVYNSNELDKQQTLDRMGQDKLLEFEQIVSITVYELHIEPSQFIIDILSGS